MTFNANTDSPVIASNIPRSVWLWTGGTAIILFFCSSLRHALFQSTAFDLGIFDQAVYLISQNQHPISTFIGFHILGDHAAFIFYPIALLYKIYPDVHWLFALQALTLAGGIPLVWKLAIQASLSTSLASAVTFTYLLYPVVFNVNLFDFHPDVFIIPGILGAVFSLRSQKLFPFLLWVLLILGSKAALSLNLIAFGIWIIFFEKPKYYGVLTTLLSSGWFLFSTQIIFPFYTGGEHIAIGRYSYLGDSVFEIILNLFRQPHLIFQQTISWSSLEYIILLILPVCWSFSRKTLKFFVPMIPQLALNLLSTVDAQRDLIHQYSLPILPFFLLAIIDSLVNENSYFRTRKTIIIWMIVSFIALAKPGYFWTRYLSYWGSISETRDALQLVDSSGGVLTIANIAPHLSHRSIIRQTLVDMDLSEIDGYGYNYVLLNGSDPGWGSNLETHKRLVDYLSQSKSFQKKYSKNEVILFQRVIHPNVSG